VGKCEACGGRIDIVSPKQDNKGLWFHAPLACTCWPLPPNNIKKD